MCEHTWVKKGLWDGRTPSGEKTGGIMYECTKCGTRANTLEKIKELGGTLEK